MRALRIEQFGEPGQIRISDVPTPSLGKGKLLVEVHAAGVNPSDAKNLEGQFPQTVLPRILGRDFAGVVVQGARETYGPTVWGTGGELGFTVDGTHAQFVAVPRASLVLKPKTISMEQAGALGVPFLTAALMTLDYANIDDDESVVVMGGMGAVGSAACQIARWKRARVISVHRGKTPNPYAHENIDSETEDITARVLQLTLGFGAHAVLDTVSGPVFEPGLRSLRRGGRYVTITAPKDGRVSFDLRFFYRNELRLMGIDSLKLSSAEAGEVLNRVREGFDQGKLLAPEVSVFSLDQAADAYRTALAGGAKAVIAPQR